MTETSKAWVWSQYRGVVDDTAQATPLPLFGNSATGDNPSTSSKRIKWGASLAVAMLIGLLFPKTAFVLLIFAGLLVLSGMDQKRFEDFCNQIPGGSIVLKIFALSDAILP
jgi:hypothetical protein